MAKSAKGKSVARQKKKKVHVPEGIIRIRSTYNNTIVTLTDKEGRVLAWSSGGHIGYKGARKGTAFSAQQAGEKVLDEAQKSFSMKRVDITTKGPGPGREPVIRVFQGSDVEVATIRDITPQPHNGTREKRPKRK